MKRFLLKVIRCIGLTALLALAALPAFSQTRIDVPCGDDDEAALIAAIDAANVNQDADVINLTASCVYSFTAEHSNVSALPLVSSPITINGNGASIERADGSPDFRFFLVHSPNGNLRLNDVSLVGGSTQTDPGAAIHVQWGGSLTVVNGTLSGNNTTFARGGAIAIADTGGTAALINSVVSGNSAGFGGGIYVYSPGTMTIINSLVSGNYASSNGGGVVNGGTMVVINSTIAGNRTAFSDGIGGIYNTGDLTVTNSIAWGNTGTQVSDTGTASVTHSTVQGEFTGTGNLDTDPLFVSPADLTSAPTTAGDYQLHDSSPALNVGDNTALPADTYDLNGDLDTAETLPIDLAENARIVNGIVDMGAYENTAPPNLLSNGSFETAGSSAHDALNWTQSKLRSPDKRRCGTVSKPLVTAVGSCMFQFKSAAPTKVARSLKQVIIAPDWGADGDGLTLSAMVEGNTLKTGATMMLRVNYTDGTNDKISTPIGKGTYAFTEISVPLALTGPVEKVIVKFKIKTTQGRLRIDRVRLVLDTSESSLREMRERVLPLPAAPFGFRGGN